MVEEQCEGSVRFWMLFHMQPLRKISRAVTKGLSRIEFRRSISRVPRNTVPATNENADLTAVAGHWLNARCAGIGQEARGMGQRDNKDTNGKERDAQSDEQQVAQMVRHHRMAVGKKHIFGAQQSLCTILLEATARRIMLLTPRMARDVRRHHTLIAMYKVKTAGFGSPVLIPL
jgi:hypothetical protein